MPISLFDANFYRAANSDLASFTDAQAQSHFQQWGVNEGRLFSPWVNLSFYRASNPDLASFSNRQLFDHLQAYGVQEERRFSEFVDLSFYRSLSPDLSAFRGEQLFEHLRQWGVNEGRRISPFVDLGVYRSRNTDLSSFSLQQALTHLEVFGLNEGRQFSTAFDVNYYRSLNSDLAASVFNNLQLLQHFEIYGVDEGRISASGFNNKVYLANNADLSTAGLSYRQAFQHFVTYGYSEGRPGSDYAGNTLATARGDAYTPLDFVGAGDRDDFYRVTISSPSTLGAFVTGLSANASLRLLNSTGGQIQAIDAIDQRVTTLLQPLDPGTYYLQISLPSSTQGTNYSLSSSIVPQVPVVDLPGIDLLGTGFDVVQEPLYAGDGFDVSFQVRNNPSNNRAANAGAFRVGFYLSTDSTMTTLDRPLGVYDVSSLDSAAVLSHTIRLTLPNPTDNFWAGDQNYYVGMVVDLSESVPEGNETNNASTGLRLDFDDVAVTLVRPTVTIAATDAIAAEPNNPGQFTITRTGSTTNSLTVNYSIGGTATNGSDYSAIANSVTLLSGQSSALLPIALVDDTLIEGNETVVLSLTDSSAYLLSNSITATVTIADNDPLDGVGNTIATALDLGVLNGSRTFSDWVGISDTNDYYRFSLISGSNFSLGLNGLSTDADVILLNSSGGFLGSSVQSGISPESIVTFLNPGTYYVRVYPYSGSTNYTLTLSATATPTVTIVATDSTAGEPNNPGQFTLTRTGSTESALTVNYTIGGSATNGVDYSSLNNRATFAAGQTSVVLPVAVLDDAVAEGEETIILTLSSSTAYTLGSTTTGTVTIADNETVDLVSRFFDAPEPLTAGSSPTFNFRIQNAGAANSGRFGVSFYLSPDSTITTSDRKLGEYHFDDLAANTTTDLVGFTLNLPIAGDVFWSGSKTYYIGMVIDERNLIRESDETNNSNRGNGLDWDDVSMTVNSVVLTDPIAATGNASRDPAINALLIPSHAYWNTSANGGIITYSFYKSSSGRYSGSEIVSEVNDAIKANVRQIMGVLESLINVRFVEVVDALARSGVVRYMLSDGPSYAYAYYPGSGIGGDVHLNAADADDFSFGYSSYGYMTLIHETLHALGLKHPGNYNGPELGDPPFLPGGEDNITNTVMTYNTVGSSAIGPMPYDIRALQYLYGTKPARASNTTYNFRSTTGYQADSQFFGSTLTQLKQTLLDTGGVDTLDFSIVATSENYYFDLREGGILTTQSAYNASRYTAIGDGGSYSTSSYGTSIAYGTVIENLINSRSSDTILANSANNVFKGYAIGTTTGNDTIELSSGSDVLELAGYNLTGLTATISGTDLTIGLGSNGTVRIKDYYGVNGSMKIWVNGTYYTYRSSGGWQATSAPALPPGGAAQIVATGGLTATVPTGSEQLHDPERANANLCTCSSCSGKGSIVNLSPTSLIS